MFKFISTKHKFEMGLFDLFKKTVRDSTVPEDKSVSPAEPDPSKWTGKNFEFLITGDLEITAENHDQIMTPNSFEWTKIEKDNWLIIKLVKMSSAIRGNHQEYK